MILPQEAGGKVTTSILIVAMYIEAASPSYFSFSPTLDVAEQVPSLFYYRISSEDNRRRRLQRSALIYCALLFISLEKSELLNELSLRPSRNLIYTVEREREIYFYRFSCAP